MTEDFCGDSAQFIPPVIRLAQELDNVEIRLLLRDQYRELASGDVRKDGYQAIPVLILLERWRRAGLSGRTSRARQRGAGCRNAALCLENPHLEGIYRTYDKMAPETRAAVRANSERFRDVNQAEWTRWLLEDLAAIVAEPVVTSAAVAD